jgi:hypothetical protein
LTRYVKNSEGVAFCDNICPGKVGAAGKSAQVWLLGIVKIQRYKEMKYSRADFLELHKLDEIVNILTKCPWISG